MAGVRGGVGVSRKFSERLGLIQPRQVFQRGRIDERLRNRLWSVCDRLFWSPFERDADGDYLTRRMTNEIWDEFFGWRTDSVSQYSASNLEVVRQWAFSANWNEFYDFIQFIADTTNVRGVDTGTRDLVERGKIFISWCNDVLAAEKSAYRFVGRELTEITD